MLNHFTLNEKIRILRRKSKLTQEEAASRCGVAREKFKTWEEGTRKIKAEDLLSLSKTFNVSADVLLGLSDDSTFFIPICPCCGQECETVYRRKEDGKYIGCSVCLDELDPWETPDCFPGKESE